MTQANSTAINDLCAEFQSKGLGVVSRVIGDDDRALPAVPLA